jgi:hypothetical protein
MSIETALDRSFLLVGELVEESLQGGGVAARRGPHHPASGVLGDAGQEKRRSAP